MTAEPQKTAVLSIGDRENTPLQNPTPGDLRENGWRAIETAPRDGTPFLALNHDQEVWAARYFDGTRLAFRRNQRREPRMFQVRMIDGEKWLKEDEAFARDQECWSSDWTFWMRLYEFAPTHWMPLPPLPTPPVHGEG